MRTKEEQIAAIEEFCGVLGISNDSPDAEIIEQWLAEAEQRVRAEIARDSERLDWLESLPLADIFRAGGGWEIGINHVSFSEGKQTLRDTIDAAREVG